MATITIDHEITSDVRAQTTNDILMIEPVSFNFNTQTARDNFFQQKTSGAQPKALKEFKTMVELLRNRGVNVITVKDTLLPHTPDSIFPSNTVSFHSDARSFLYPMCARNRRLEMGHDTLYKIKRQGFVLREIFDMRPVADSNLFLEGLGSMVLDRNSRTAYACRSERTSEEWLLKTCKRIDFRPVIFNARQHVMWRRLPVYHTNIMMSVAETFIIICLDAIDDAADRKKLLDSFHQSGKEVISITESQMKCFAGNALQVRTSKEKYDVAFVMSSRAHASLNATQISCIEKHCPIIHTDISTIEENGGGSVGCMMAEIFLPRRKSVQ